MRRIYATLGERWSASSWLAQPEDFFFLAAPEIEAVLDAGHPVAAGLNLPQVVEQRRRAYRHWLDYPAPDALDWQGQPIEPLAPYGGEVLTGIPASAGEARGVARVILDPSEASALEPGTILVTRATDPGWTPVFSIISGLVLEIGGQLSHGAIVAREYGLPAVVNVPGATRRIGDGQFVIVDGGSGEVKLAGQKR
jgi:phosphoenolpyruvate synthase/pyruvate phosphate dikinase